MNADNEIYQTIKRVIAQELNPAEIVDLQVTEDIDYDDDPVLRITIVFKAENNRLDPKKTLGLWRHLRGPLANLKEDRFPVFSFIEQSEMDGAAA